jgi:hypothetical protein
VTVTVLLAPAAVGAQSVARSFAELQPLVKIGQTVIVTDVNGETTKGRVIDLSASTLAVRTPEPKAFPESRVVSVRRTDSLWNGALIGAGAGGAVAVAGFQATRGESDAVYGWAYVASWLAPVVGAVVGAFVDRSVGNAPIYLASPPISKTRVSVCPLVTPKAAGASISVLWRL